jgi:hypothetical protein
MNMVSGLRLTIGLPFYIKGQSLASNKRFSKAAAALQTYFRVAGCPPGSVKAYPEANVLMALILLRTGDLEGSVRLSEAAFNQLKDGSWRYSQNDKSYLMTYCSNLARLCQSRDSAIHVSDKLYDVTILDFDWHLVSSRLKKDFPLSKQVLGSG